MIKNSLIVLVFVFLCSLNAQFNRNNVVITEKIFAASLDNFIEENPKLKHKAIFFNFRNFEEFDWLQNSLREYFVRKNFSLSLQDSADYYFGINLQSINIDFPQYTSLGIFSEKEIERKINLIYDITLWNNKNLSEKLFKSVNVSEIDTIKVSEYFEFKKDNRLSNIGDLPERNLFASLIEPALFVSSTTALIVLLFTVRSK